MELSLRQREYLLDQSVFFQFPIVQSNFLITSRSTFKLILHWIRERQHISLIYHKYNLNSTIVPDKKLSLEGWELLINKQIYQKNQIFLQVMIA